MNTRSGARTGSSRIPKVADAVAAWRWYSRELDADFARFYHRDIRDWYVGDMSSRQFLNLIDGLPEHSLFKTWAVRGGDWTENQYLQARLINEVALSRADGKGYAPHLVKSPMEYAAEQATETYRRNRHDETLKALRGET